VEVLSEATRASRFPIDDNTKADVFDLAKADPVRDATDSNNRIRICKKNNNTSWYYAQRILVTEYWLRSIEVTNRGFVSQRAGANAHISYSRGALVVTERIRMPGQ